VKGLIALFALVRNIKKILLEKQKNISLTPVLSTNFSAYAALLAGYEKMKKS